MASSMRTSRAPSAVYTGLREWPIVSKPRTPILAIGRSRWLCNAFLAVLVAMKAAGATDEYNAYDQLLASRTLTACDQQEFFVRCPGNTFIDVVEAAYGRSMPGFIVCPYAHRRGYAPLDFDENVQCSAPNTFLIVQQTCQERRACKMNVNPSFFGSDPCPKTGKYLNMTYRCMPIGHQEQSTCEGSTFLIQCDRGRRLYIESVRYWAPSSNDAVNGGCNLNASSTSSLEAADIYEACAWLMEDHVQRQCASRRSCSLEVSRACSKQSTPNRILWRLDVKYTCVPRSVIGSKHSELRATLPNQQPMLERTQLNDRPGEPVVVEVQKTDTDMSTNSKLRLLAPFSQLPAKKEFNINNGNTVKASAAVPTVNCDVTATDANRTLPATRNEQHADNLLMGWVHSVKYVKDNEEKLTLYGLLCGCLALLLALMLFTARLLYLRHTRSRMRGKLNVSEPLTTADQSSSEGNTYVPALDPSDVAMLSYNLTSGQSYDAEHSNLFCRSDDARNTFYENDDGNDSDRTRINSLYDRHS